MLSKTSLKILYQLSIGNAEIKGIAAAIGKSDKQIYRECIKLKNLRMIKSERGHILPEKLPHVTLLLQTLREHSNVIDLFSGSGTIVLAALVTKKNIEQISKETGLKKSIIYRIIKKASHIGMIYKREGYTLNEKGWPKAFEFFEELSRVNKLIDSRVPATSEIFYKNDREIVFSDSSEIDAAKTAFSVYGEYGIKLYLLTNYYYLPKQKLTKNEILLHSIYVAERTGSREIIFLSLFYINYKKEIRLRHPMLKNIDRIIRGEKVQNYPNLSEIKSRCEVYDIEI